MPEHAAPLLSLADVAVAAGLLLVAGVVSIVLRLGLERRLAVGAVRAVVQLMGVGYVLKLVFSERYPAATAVMAAVMVVTASRAATGRVERTFPGMSRLAFLSLVIAGTVTVWLATQVIIGARPWYTPRVMIPLLGMVLGNGLNGIAVGLDELLARLVEHRREVEMELAHGATRWEAARRPLRVAVRRGLIPITNTMMVVGLVTLPGLMTGQILAGADPLQAVRYQVVIIFMIAAATALGSILMGLLVVRHLFTPSHRLQVDRVRRRDG